MTMTGIIIGLTIVLLFISVFWLVGMLDKQKKENAKLVQTIVDVQKSKKSSEVRLGKMAEHMAPFINGWPYDANNFRFLGSPVDGIQFTDNEIIFVEIKTGRSRLSKRQAIFKKLVGEKKVTFQTFRVNENGITLKKE